MTMISSAITSTATRAAMMAMPIVDITTEKLSSISQIDMNRKVKILIRDLRSTLSCPWITDFDYDWYFLGF